MKSDYTIDYLEERLSEILSELDWDIYYYTVYEDCKKGEIAKLLNISRITVWKHFKTIKKEIATLMKEFV